jgi:hypothetical protein
MCHCAWSTNLHNEAALAHVGLLRHKKITTTSEKTDNILAHYIIFRSETDNPGGLWSLPFLQQGEETNVVTSCKQFRVEQKVT